MIEWQGHIYTTKSLSFVGIRKSFTCSKMRTIKRNETIYKSMCLVYGLKKLLVL